MLVIDPEICIDCGVCVIACPAKAIKSDTEAGMEKWVALNKKYADIWPEITRPESPLPNADQWRDRKDKLTFLKES
jgi:ferredoxin